MKFGIKNIFSSLRKPELDLSGRNLLLTGVPRSGTTLACRLLSECPGMVALNEPMSRERFPDRAGALGAVDTAFRSFRESLLRSGTAPARGKDGQITDNAYSQDATGRRQRVVQRSDINFGSPLSAGFTLAMKHNAEFTLLLPEIAQRYETYAIVRNPLALLSSWASVDVPVSRGKVAKAERLLPAFHQQLTAIDDLLERQLFILSWYFGQYRDFPESRILRYEELIASNGQALEKITRSPLEKTWALSGQNANPLYDLAHIERAAQALLRSAGHYWRFYEKSAVENLLNELLS
jgi:hypothetical protein